VSVYRITADADRDLAEITSYISADSPAAANRLLDSFVAMFETPASAPAAGRRRDDLRRGVRSFPVGVYLVSYRQVGTDIEILRVIHGRRDIEKAFNT
jgi:toxin ParE1/3/4